MSKPLPPSPYWSRHSSIPIHLDITEITKHEQHDQHDESSGRICSTCAISSRNQPIHCVQVASSSPAPPSYQSVLRQSSNHLAVPSPFQYGMPRPRPPRPALRFDYDTRPRVRFRGSAASPLSTSTTIFAIDTNCQAKTTGSSLPNTPQDDNESLRTSKLGLGIPEAPFYPDPSPIRSPASEILASAEKGEYNKKSTNVAQRIEEKLLEYSHSGNVAKRWLLEIVSWTISALCMTAIIVVLFVYSGKPPPSEWPLDITLNTYISTVSKVASASLLLPASECLGQLKWNWFQGGSKKMWDFEIFDNASRGPWGSFLLLIRTKGMTLAALGAAITIFSLALDPFFQQVVNYPERWVLQSQLSSIPKVTRYAPDVVREYQGGSDSTITDKSTQQITDQYFYDYGAPVIKVGNVTRPDIPVSCPFGNCTWEPYETLGVCSKCADVADMLEFACLKGPLDWIQSATSYIPYSNGTMCGWFFNATSDKPMLMSGYQVDPSTNQTLEVLTTRSLPLITNINRRPLFGGSINFRNIPNPLTNFVVVSPALGSNDDQLIASIMRHEKPRASECVLAMCVKRIQSSYDLSGYTENITDIFYNTTAGSFPWTQEKVNGSALNITNAVVYHYYEGIDIIPAAMGSKENFTVYGASNDTAYNVIRVFDDYLPSFGTRRSNDSTIWMKYKTAATVPTTRDYTKNPWLAPRNVSDHMDRLATSLTNMMRFASPESIKGKAYSEETLAEVRWPWLSLPVGLLVMTLVFLVATILRTSSKNNEVGIWKNSAIANIIFGLPDNHKQKLLAPSKAGSTPRTKAKTLHVRMLPSKDWRISGISFLSPNPNKVTNEKSPQDRSAPEKLTSEKHSPEKPTLEKPTSEKRSPAIPVPENTIPEKHKPYHLPGWL